MAGGKATGRIIEEREDYRSELLDREHGGVGFGFWPWGNLAEEFADNPLLSNLCSIPQIIEADDLVRAPDSFLEALTRHLARKTGL